MTTAADDTAAEAAFEAFLAGRPAPAGADDSFHAVAAFAGSVRATATLPGRPNAALAELLATGLLTDQSSPSTRTATSAGKSPRRSRVRRRRFAVLFPALIAKFLSAGAVAQAASGAGIALVAFTGAGVVGVLPDPVQDTFTSVVGASEETTDDVATQDETLTDDETTTDPGEVDAPEVVTEVPVEAELTPEQWAATGPREGQNFGDWVHAAFPDGKADGQIVSHWARLKHVNLDEIEALEDVEGLEDLDATPTIGEAEAEPQDAEVAERGDGNGRGNGGGNGNAGGNSGGGNGNGRGHN